MKTKILITLILSVIFLNSTTYSCTTFCIKDVFGNILFGRNYDFPIGVGQVQVNLKGIEKTSLISLPEKTLN